MCDLCRLSIISFDSRHFSTTPFLITLAENEDSNGTDIILRLRYYSLTIMIIIAIATEKPGPG